MIFPALLLNFLKFTNSKSQLYIFIFIMKQRTINYNIPYRPEEADVNGAKLSNELHLVYKISQDLQQTSVSNL